MLVTDHAVLSSKCHQNVTSPKCNVTKMFNHRQSYTDNNQKIRTLLSCPCPTDGFLEISGQNGSRPNPDKLQTQVSVWFLPFGLKPSNLKSGSNFPWNKFLNKSRHFKVTVEGKLGDIAIHVDSSCKNMMIRVLGTIYFPSWSIFLSTSDAIIPRRKLKKRQRLKYRYQTVLSSLGPKNTVLNQSEI